MSLKSRTLFLILAMAFLTTSCAGQRFSYSYQPGFSPSAYNSISADNEELDKEFKIKDFDKETIDDKIGYILLGIIGVAVTAAAIAIPFLLFK